MPGHGDGVDRDDDVKIRYQVYLCSGPWLSLRAQVLLRCGGWCECCGLAMVSDIHHLRYHRWGAESADDLLGLCRECHSILHGTETNHGEEVSS